MASRRNAASATRKDRKWRKPQDKPKHPLSAYNIFFQSERARIIAESTTGGVSHVTTNDTSAIFPIDNEMSETVDPSSSPRRQRNRIPNKQLGGFAGLARGVASRWKTLDPATKALYEEQARVDRQRYHSEVAIWKQRQQQASTSIVSTPTTPIDVDWVSNTTCPEPRIETTTACSMPTLFKASWSANGTPDSLVSQLNYAGSAAASASAFATPRQNHISALSPMGPNHQTSLNDCFQYPSLARSEQPTVSPMAQTGSRHESDQSSEFDPSSILSVATKLALLKQERDRLVKQRRERQRSLLADPNYGRRPTASASSNFRSHSPDNSGDNESQKVVAHEHSVQRNLFHSVADIMGETGDEGDTPCPSVNQSNTTGSVEEEDDDFDLKHLDLHIGLSSPCSWLEIEE